MKFNLRLPKKELKTVHLLVIALVVVVAVLATVLIVQLSNNPSPGGTSAQSTIESTTEAPATFLISPTEDVDVSYSSDGRTITLIVLEGTSTLDLTPMVTAVDVWSVSDANKQPCVNGVLTITGEGDTFTLLYGYNTVYLLKIEWQKFFRVTFEGVDEFFSVKKNGRISAPSATPEKTGYTFNGWDFDFDSSVEADIQISAKWDPNTYKVTLNPNGGSVSTPLLNVIYGSSVELPIPTRDGFGFAGWYNGDVQVSSGEWMILGDVTLFAIWDTHDYRITYDANGGTVDKTIQGISYGEAFTVPIPKRTGYTFMGWYADGKSVNTSAYAYTSDMTFVAEWLENRYTVEYVTNGGQPISGGSVLFSEIGETVPSRPGYTFGGWFFNADLNETNVVVGNDGVVTVYAWWSEENKAADFGYTISNDGVTLTDYKSLRAICVVPSYIAGLPVVAVGDETFADCSTVTHIELPESCLSIGKNAFANATKLLKINPIENTAGARPIDLTGFVSIGEGAFRGCSFTSVALPDTLTHLSGYLFADCTNLTEVDLTYILSVGDGVFMNCTSLSSLILPDGVKSLGDDFFRGCSSLTTLSLPASVQSLGNGVFAGCVLLREMKLPSTLTVIGESLFDGCTSLVTLEGFTNNTAITSIGARAFADCQKLKGLAIPSGVISIGQSAFENCLEIRSLTLPAAVTVIENGTFRGCSYLATLTVNGRLTKIGEYAFDGCRRLTAISLTSALTSIGEGAFADCFTLSGVQLTESLSYLGDKAFYGCSKLTSIYISSGLDSIPNAAFSGCTALTTVTWHNGIVSIGEEAFYDCRAFTPDFMPSSLQTIGREAFAGCYGIQTLRFERDLVRVYSRAFADCINLTAITFGGSAERWKGAVYDDAFDGCDDLRGNVTVTIGVVEDLHPSLYTNEVSQALWSIDSTLAMNDQRPAAVIRFRNGNVFYRNLITVTDKDADPAKRAIVNSDYTWTLLLEGETTDNFSFNATITVTLFEVYDLGDHGYVMMDLGERFASMTGLASCRATLQIYGKNSTSTALYKVNLGEYNFGNENSTLVEDADRTEDAEVSVTVTSGPDLGYTYGAKNLFDGDLDTKFFSVDRTPIILQLDSPAALGSYSLITGASQIAYPAALPTAFTLYGGVTLKDGSVEWLEISRVDAAYIEWENLVEYNYKVTHTSAFSLYKIEFDGEHLISLAEIVLYQKNS